MQQGSKKGIPTLRRGLGSRVGPFHSWECLRYPLEQRLDVVAQFRTRLHEHEVVLFCLLLALLRGDLSFVVQVSLVAHEHDDHVVSPFGPYVVDPLSCVLERFRVCTPVSCLSGVQPGSASLLEMS